jgi:hypothetical protein
VEKVSKRTGRAATPGYARNFTAKTESPFGIKRLTRIFLPPTPIVVDRRSGSGSAGDPLRI